MLADRGMIALLGCDHASPLSETVGEYHQIFLIPCIDR